MFGSGTRLCTGGTTAMIAFVMVVGCSPQGDEQLAASPTEVQGVSLQSELDDRTGAVTLPYDRFVETPEEMDTIAAAAAVAISACAAAEGVEFVPPGLITDPVYVSEQYFGPWTRDQAQRFGFVLPMTQADLAANGITGAVATSTAPRATPNADLTDADWTTIDDCGSAPDVTTLNAALTHVGPWVEPMSTVSDSLLNTGEAKDLIKRLANCYEDAGLQVRAQQPWVPVGANGREISEEQIRLALQVVECKDAIDFTRAMATIEAGLQAPIIEKYVDELVAKRQSIDDAMVLARTLLAQGTQTAESQG